MIHMGAGLWLLVLLAADGSPTISTDPYAAGLTCFEQLDYDCAIELLSAASQGTAIGNAALQMDIRLKLAESHLALGQRQEAVLDFVRLLEIHPDFQIDAEGVSPKILEALKEAKARTSRPMGPTQGETVVTKPLYQHPMLVQIGLIAGYEFLVGQDRRAMEPGPQVEIQALFAPGPWWRLGVGLLYSSHALTQSHYTLQSLGGWGGAGLGIDLGPFECLGLAGVGATRFGVWGHESKTGLLLPVRLQVNVRLGQVVRLGVQLAPLWTISFLDAAQTSFTYSGALHFALAF